ncbi:hypothetical protein OUZ56_018421 [Daphnia magna]|uniref:Uncharacterized protein n=1 Tax=Daphnia magna TaxID=35525 RepID=A0ABQ9Z8S5_9CRUS|nr:hypothetical protein OUZ56_018421 [Daphnia magna]
MRKKMTNSPIAKSAELEDDNRLDGAFVFNVVSLACNTPKLTCSTGPPKYVYILKKKCINEKNKKLLPNAVPTIFQLPTKATNVRGETITTPFSNVTGQSCQQLEPHRSDAQNSTVFDHPEDNHYEQDLYSNYRSSTPASNHNSGFLDEEVVSLINSARNDNVMKEVDAIGSPRSSAAFDINYTLCAGPQTVPGLV